MNTPLSEQTGCKILAALERIEMMLARRLPRQAPKRALSISSAIPMKEIVDLWCEVCPHLEHPAMLTNDRRRLLRDLWRRFEKLNGIPPMQAIRDLFEMVAASDFLSGRSRSSRFRADLFWVIEPNHTAAIIEGRYANEARNA